MKDLLSIPNPIQNNKIIMNNVTLHIYLNFNYFKYKVNVSIHTK